MVSRASVGLLVDTPILLSMYRFDDALIFPITSTASVGLLVETPRRLMA